MVYRGYENKVELSAFGKDPNTQDMLARPPLLKKDVCGHDALDIVTLVAHGLSLSRTSRIARVHSLILIGLIDPALHKTKYLTVLTVSMDIWVTQRRN